MRRWPLRDRSPEVAQMRLAGAITLQSSIAVLPTGWRSVDPPHSMALGSFAA
jgi:hypothetical protein